MAKGRPITQKDLIELSDAILGGVGKMMEGVDKRAARIEKRSGRMEKYLAEMEERNVARFDSLSKDINSLHKYLDDLTRNIVSKKEFDALKETVFMHHPAN